MGMAAGRYIKTVYFKAKTNTRNRFSIISGNPFVDTQHDHIRLILFLIFLVSRPTAHLKNGQKMGVVAGKPK